MSAAFDYRKEMSLVVDNVVVSRINETETLVTGPDLRPLRSFYVHKRENDISELQSTFYVLFCGQEIHN